LWKTKSVPESDKKYLDFLQKNVKNSLGGQIVDNFWITSGQKNFKKIQKNAKKLKNSRKNAKKRKKARKSPKNAKNPLQRV